MTKREFKLMLFVILITLANIYLWFQIVDGDPAPRSGRVLGLIISLGIGALFSDQFSQNRYDTDFIRVGCLLGMTGLFFILLNR